MEQLTIQTFNKTAALQEAKQYVMVELIDAETKQIIGYAYEKDFIKFWKKKLDTQDNRGQGIPY